ncbi:hypothetical protein CB0940_08421 [Cercospora beticola]|uniref:Uncharacterized protein n=1 Tax=Cercospora beticola TaxID=122368 RepID=A0A2G5HQJ8_CERBT|nr:hypothetical protein CB0940_08421 [Cercospora beticola]PIA94816.1 hypothetical protein CB0940_08421 [Cercospora beticola]WPB04997.1 hypothetical protein RHO25_009645 [Cercospora beticola]CAK1364775.1 unnamed protein product [Cercospora beticola]
MNLLTLLLAATGAMAACTKEGPINNLCRKPAGSTTGTCRALWQPKQGCRYEILDQNQGCTSNSECQFNILCGDCP